ncbi:MAG: glycosyltransferase family 1 protein [Chloroflexi bacterium]|nr:MAG: glycosyltransferase family 1 protein [Chloroflexota bacterium]
MKIAVLGTRGVPAAYSGFETCAEQVGKRLAGAGHTVIIYCRRGRTATAGPTYLGMRRVLAPCIRSKGLETLTHTICSSLRALAIDRPDAALVEPAQIPYGAEIDPQAGTRALERFGLRPGSYLLAVGRLVPENGFHDLIAGYARARLTTPLVIVGDAPYAASYKRRLRKLAPPGVVFTGYQFGAAYQELSAHALAFVFGASVGGTHPVLVEQLAHGNYVIARWTESNQEVAGDAAAYFHQPDELAGRLRELGIERPALQAARDRSRARARRYSWQTVTDQYEQVLAQLVSPAAASKHATATRSGSPRQG